MGVRWVYHHGGPPNDTARQVSVDDNSGQELFNRVDPSDNFGRLSEDRLLGRCC